MAATSHYDSEPATKKMKSDPTMAVLPPLVGPYPTSDLFLRLLLSARVDDVRPPENKIFVAQRTDKIMDVWKGLASHNFLSVPVLQKTKNKWYGFVDIYDIVKFVVEFFGLETNTLKESEDWFKLLENSEEFNKKTVNDIMKYPLSKRNPFFPITSGYSLFAAVEPLAREQGLHRIPVVDRERKLVTVVSQSHLVQILYNNLDILGEKKNKPVGQLENYLEQVLTIHEEATAMEAFKMMVDHNVSGLAVVDKDGKLTANISMKDLKAMSTDTRLFWRLYQTVHNFLLKVRKENNEIGGDRPRTSVTVKALDSMEMVIRRLHENKIHRIYIVDDHKKPVGVISLKDVLAEILS